MLFVVLSTNMLLLFIYFIHSFSNILKFVVSGNSHKEWLFNLRKIVEVVKYKIFI